MAPTLSAMSFAQVIESTPAYPVDEIFDDATVFELPREVTGTAYFVPNDDSRMEAIDAAVMGYDEVELEGVFRLTTDQDLDGTKYATVHGVLYLKPSGYWDYEFFTETYRPYKPEVKV